ncbi:MAG TPA: acyl carrier protein [Deltaproteobacteria bacterium]|nr:acyl carrier protein [Candidatus Binatota bacterium]HIL13711.1 acyl carrier protein [Deltaproteobacteria bacterium]
MSQLKIEQKVREIMSGIFAVDEADLDENSSLETVENWDSLQHVNLIMALEEDFGVQIDVDDALEMVSFPEVVATMLRYSNAG